MFAAAVSAKKQQLAEIKEKTRAAEEAATARTAQWQAELDRNLEEDGLRKEHVAR